MDNIEGRHFELGWLEIPDSCPAAGRARIVEWRKQILANRNVKRNRLTGSGNADVDVYEKDWLTRAKMRLQLANLL